VIPKIDKEFASLIPPLSADEYSQLEQNLLAEGCRDRILVWGDILIDGHNRLKICTAHNIPYEVTALEFAGREEAIKHIILNQFGRRNLSLANRSLLALRLEPMYRAQAKDNQRKSPGRGQKGPQVLASLLGGIETRGEIAKIAGVSHTTIARTRHIVEHGTREQIERIKKGGKGNTVNAVYDEVRKTTVQTPGVPTKKGDGPESSAVPSQPANTPAGHSGADDGPGKTGSGNARETSNAPPADSKENDWQRIRSYVADLKNPNLNRSFTPEMFLAEYMAFTERFIRSVGIFKDEPYKAVYPLLSAAQRKAMGTMGGAMITAIRRQNSMVGDGDTV
jgi:hypothetical protein